MLTKKQIEDLKPYYTKIEHGEGWATIERRYSKNNNMLIMEANWWGDVLNGSYKNYYENGQLEFEGFYRSGKADGVFTWYDKNGKIRYKFLYKNDVFIENLLEKTN